MATVARLFARKLVQPPRWLPDCVMYETVMGSMAYGVGTDTSDMDVYGFCIPPKAVVFPHLAGDIPGFGRQKNRFEVWQQHHVVDPSENGGKGREYDFSVYSIVKFFHLAMENNPNMIDALFTPRHCVLHTTPIAELVRENRRIFLHKGAWHKFKGYAYSQLHKMEIKSPDAGSKRAELVEKFGYDVKFAYHVVRLIDEVEQILTLGDMDLTRDAERLKAIRRGEWTAIQVKEHFARREKELEEVYAASKLPHAPDEARIKALLLQCLEMHYGSLEGAITEPGKEKALLAEIKKLCEQAGV
jgi:uncharacterized protein